MTNPIVGMDVENDIDDQIAMQMIKDLCHAYPGHGWFVLIRGGIVQVKIMDINPYWGMALHYNDIKGDASKRKASLIRAAGEFLERCNLKRGSNTGEAVTKIDGVPDKFMGKR